MFVQSRISAILVPALLIAAGAPALAAPEKAPRTTSVAYNDLNLSTKKGERALMQRIRKAAARVCYTGARDPVAAREFSECQSAVMSTAKAEAQAAIAAARSGQAPSGSAGIITVRQSIAG